MLDLRSRSGDGCAVAKAAIKRRSGRTIWRIGRRLALRATSHRLDLAAAGVAYYALLALFPGLAALVAGYGLLGDADQVGRSLSAARAVAPPSVVVLAREQLSRLAQAPDGALAISGVFSFGLALWGLNRGVAGFRGALIAVDPRPGRSGLVPQTVRSLVLTASGLLVAMAALTLLAVAPALAALAPDQVWLQMLVKGVRWPVLLAASGAYAAMLYRWGVNRRRRAWRFVLWPAFGASIGWLLVSAALGAYVEGFAAISETYGSLAGAVVLLLWLFVTAYVFLLGAELSFVLEEAATDDAEAEAA
ncbi:MAG: YihY/virulence factor BrkB family protein, partial [Hyphomonadaceae bacterium]|nr:YihY/virulence factor BrkB family protein [Hyphomonadaceae bacterium]